MEILTVLPPREGFSMQAFGAVSLSVRDFTLHSRFADSIRVVGLVDEPPFEGIIYKPLPLERRWYQRQGRAYLKAVLKYIEGHLPQLIEVHNRPAFALSLSRCISVPIALHLHNDPQEMRKAGTVRERIQLLQHMHVYCISAWVRQRFLEGVPAAYHAKAFVTPCGYDMPTQQTKKRNEILYVGRMTPNKGVLEAVQAMAMVLPEFPDWKGRVIGGRRHSVSESLSDYEQQLHDAAIPAIALEGFQPYEATQAAIAQAAIMVVPSIWNEPFGRTALEGMAHACAVITSGRGGLREIVDSHAVITNVEPHAMAQAMRELMHNEKQRTAMQRTGPSQAAQYRIEKCVQTLDDAREQIMKDYGAGIHVTKAG